MANAREFTPDEFNQRVSDLAAYFQGIMKYRDFVVGAEYFAWSDEWWKKHDCRRNHRAESVEDLLLDE